MRGPVSDTSSSPVPASIVRPAVVYFLLFGAVAAYFPYIAVYFRSIGLGLPAIGLLAALNAGVAVVAAPAWGALVDRTRDVRGPLLVAGLWSAAAGNWLAVTREPILVGIAVVTLAAGSAGLGPMLDSRTIEIVGKNRDRYGRARAFGSLAFTIGALGVGILIGQTGPQGMFLVYVPGLFLTGVVAYVLLGRPDRAQPGQRGDSRPVSRPGCRISFATRRCCCSSSAPCCSGSRSRRSTRSCRSTSSSSARAAPSSASSGRPVRSSRCR